MTLPNNWTNKTLRDLATINYGRDPSAILDDAGEYPVYGTSGNERQGTGYHYEGESIILGRKGSIDRVHFATGRFWTIDTAYFLSDFDDTVPKWLYYLLCSIDLRALNEATGVPSLSRDLLYQISTPTPPPAEQSKIAEVLSTVDLAIEQTEALIAKQQRIKTGLMQDLLTRGIDEHGNLRSEQTHEFKDSPLGRIPVEWDVNVLGKIGAFANGINKAKEDFGFGTLFVNIADVYPDHLDVHSLGRLNARECEISRYGVTIGDILIDRSSVKLEGVGYPTVFEGHDEPVVFCGFIIRFRPTVEVNARFLCLQMRDEPFRINVFKVATKSANVNVNQESLADLCVKLPPLGEQKRIVDAETKLDDDREQLQKQLGKLFALKTALMQDLLSGNRRVTALLELREGVTT